MNSRFFSLVAISAVLLVSSCSTAPSGPNTFSYGDPDYYANRKLNEMLKNNAPWEEILYLTIGLHEMRIKNHLYSDTLELNIGVAYWNLGKNNTAAEWLALSLETQQKNGVFDGSRGITRTAFDIANNFLITGNIFKASKYFEIAKTSMIKRGDDSNAHEYINGELVNVRNEQELEKDIKDFELKLKQPSPFSNQKLTNKLKLDYKFTPLAELKSKDLILGAIVDMTDTTEITSFLSEYDIQKSKNNTEIAENIKNYIFFLIQKKTEEIPFIQKSISNCVDSNFVVSQANQLKNITQKLGTETTERLKVVSLLLNTINTIEELDKIIKDLEETDKTNKELEHKQVIIPVN